MDNLIIENCGTFIQNMINYFTNDVGSFYPTTLISYLVIVVIIGLCKSVCDAACGALIC